MSNSSLMQANATEVRIIVLFPSSKHLLHTFRMVSTNNVSHVSHTCFDCGTQSFSASVVATSLETGIACLVLHVLDE